MAEVKHKSDSPPHPFSETAVEIWSVRLDASKDEIGSAMARLDPAEQEQAGGFRHFEARDRFILSHAALREILARELDAAPRDITFRNGSHGKPELAGSLAGRLDFNLTHSDQLALVALSRIGAVGVDIEKLRPFPNVTEVTKRFFSARESAELKKLPRSQLDEAFFTFWTCKEALAKATGNGIAHSLARFEITVSGKVALLGVDSNVKQATEWTLHEFTPAPGYLAAVALHQRNVQFAFRQFGSSLAHANSDT